MRKFIFLSSAVTMGPYVPALLLFDQFERGKKSSQFFILEDLSSNSTKESIYNLKKSYHDNFKLALFSQKMSGKNNDFNISENKKNILFKEWSQNKDLHFIVFSGYWVDIINDFCKEYANELTIKIHLIILDAIEPVSWQNKACIAEHEKVLIFDYAEKKVNYLFPIETNSVIENENRDSLIIHGGGWGIGNHKDILNEISTLKKFHFYIINYFDADIIASSSNCTNLYQEPLWTPIHSEDRIYTSPPLYESNILDHRISEKFSLQNYIKKSIAIISKPGGGTLIDSFALNTPIIFLKRFGNYEDYNAKLWIDLGFGIDYEKWIESDFDKSILLNMSDRIKNYKNNNYIRELEEKINS